MNLLARCTKTWWPLAMAAWMIGSLAGAHDAAAHAVAITVDPAANAVLTEAPRSVAIRFSERVEPRASSLEVLDAGGRRLDGADAAVDAADPWLYRAPYRPWPRGPTRCHGACCRPTTADDR